MIQGESYAAVLQFKTVIVNGMWQSIINREGGQREKYITSHQNAARFTHKFSKKLNAFCFAQRNRKFLYLFEPPMRHEVITMKKKLLTVFSVILIIAGLLVACSGGDGGNTGTEKEKDYTITGENGAGYTIDLPSSAKEGDTVTVNINVTDEDIFIDTVTANNTECTEKSDGVYTFVMPADNVNVTVKTSEYSEVRADGMLTMDIDVLTTIAQNATYPYTSSGLTDGKWRLRISVDSPYTTSFSRNSGVFSSNQDVIPESAIEIETLDGNDLGHGSSSSNVILAADICIDTAEISTGTTWLTISLDSENNSDKGTLVVKVTVVADGDIKVPTESKTLVVDVSALDANDGDSYTMHFYDNNYIDGGEAPEYFDVTGVVSGGKVEFVFDYATGHKYGIVMSPGEKYDFENRVSIAQSVTGTGTSDLYNGYTSAGLMFWTAEEIELEAIVE